MRKVKHALVALVVAAISLLLPALAMAQETAFTATSGEAQVSGVAGVDGARTIPSANAPLDLPGAISGYVYAADGVTPLDSAAVYVYDYMSRENLGLAFTAPDGWYSVDALTPGEYLVQAVRMGSVATYAADHLTVESAPPVAVTGGLTTEGVNFALRPAAYFSGIVTEEDGSTPIAQAAIYAYDYTTNEPVAWVEADTHGKFDLAVPAGTYRLTAYQFNYKTADYKSSTSSPTAEALSVSAGETRASLEFQLAGVGVVSGSVYQADGVTPAGGVSVLLYDSPTATVHTYITTTLSNGTFSRSVIEGTYYFSAVSPTDGTIYYDDKLTLSVANPVNVPGNTQVGNIDMQFIEAEDAATITATVSLQGRPAKPNPTWSIPLRVILTRDGETAPVYDATATTDQNGVFVVTGIPPGTYRIWVKHSHTLANAVVTALITGNNDVDIGSLREGDADNDNRVSLSDFSLLASSFGKALGLEGYDERVDFNLDNTITLPDFSLLATNFSQQGASP